MANVETQQAAVSSPPRRRPLFLLGALLFLLGPAVYAVAFYMRHLSVPWYVLPALATVGVLLMIVAAWRSRSIWRAIGLVPFLLLAGLEWFAFGIGAQLPDYTGPAQQGRKVPAFATRLANGDPFTEKNLENGTPSVLLFFRGRW
jgi:hypothetical protein